MVARWCSFGVGVGLLLAPLVVGYGSVAPILHDVAVGILVCVATLAALEWPRARVALAGPAVWLLFAGRTSPDAAAALVNVAAGALLLVLAAFPSARHARTALPPVARRGGAGARA
jgi:hypothetical protein